MAEIVGLAASVAGLVAFTGQIGKSILFIKEFLEDTKNAPEEVRSLAAEIELLGSAAKKTEVLLVKCHADGLDIDLEEERKGLKKYADMIESLKEKLEKDVKTFEAGKGHLWERVGSATRKKSVNGYLVGVERAKTMVMGIESKILIQLQHEHRTSLITTNTSLKALQLSSDGNVMALNNLETTTSQIANWTGTTDQTLTTLSHGVQQINSSMENLLPAIQNLQNATLHSTGLSALESMMESAIMRGLKRHEEELKKDGQHSSSHRTHPPSAPEPIPEFPYESTDSTEEPLYSGSYATIRRDKTVFQTAFRTPFFDINIVTKEAQRIPKPKKGTPTQELSRLQATHSQRFTAYTIRVKIPFWRGGATFQSGNPGMMYRGGLCKTFRTYNLVPTNAPIIIACEDFNLPEVRRLFETGLASPMDFDTQANRSLVDTVVWSMILHKRWMSLSIGISIDCALPLLRYLILCLTGDIGGSTAILDILDVLVRKEISQKKSFLLLEACRLVIIHSSEDPLNGIGEFITIETAATPLYSALVAQDKWWLDEDINPKNSFYQNIWLETDLQMLKDPKALRVKVAIARGLCYFPGDSPLPDLDSNYSCIHTLLELAYWRMEGKFLKCVLSRLVVLLEHGIDPRHVTFAPYPKIPPAGKARRPLSCTEYAIYLNLAALWGAALEGAGWDRADIHELFDEDRLHATTALLSGEIQYQSRDDQRRQFIEDLRRGKFVDLELHVMLINAQQWGVELGIRWSDLTSMVMEVTSVLRTRKIPGRWVDDDGINLMPGKDFQLRYKFWWEEHGEVVRDWKCIREIWDNELDGEIPEGYEDTESSEYESSEYTESSEEDD